MFRARALPETFRGEAQAAASAVMLDAARWGGTPAVAAAPNSLAGRGVRVDVISPEVVRQNLARIGAKLADRYVRVSHGETDPSTGP